MALKYKIGDRIRIKSIDWYNENKSKSHGTVACGGKYFDYDMREWCGKIMTILEVYKTCYIMEEDGAKDLWTDEMIEGLVEEECNCVTVDGIPNTIPIQYQTSSACFHNGFCGYSDSEGNETSEWNLPEGYQFVDENGNVINATKIVLEKKKKEYPKRYEECCYVLRFENTEMVFEDDYRDINPPKEQWKRLGLMNQFYQLLICRDAYWKIAGEEMGLGKPWESVYKSLEDNHYFTICTFNSKIECSATAHRNTILAFPTEEIRDAFYENFKELIESVKELL